MIQGIKGRGSKAGIMPGGKANSQKELRLNSTSQGKINNASGLGWPKLNSRGLGREKVPDPRFSKSRFLVSTSLAANIFSTVTTGAVD